MRGPSLILLSVLLTCGGIEQDFTDVPGYSVVEQTTTVAESDSNFVDLVEHEANLAGKYSTLYGVIVLTLSRGRPLSRISQ